jgi:hypothetical protein
VAASFVTPSLSLLSSAAPALVLVLLLVVEEVVEAHLTVVEAEHSPAAEEVEVFHPSSRASVAEADSL